MKIGKYGVLAGTMILGLLVLFSGCELGGEEPDYRIEFTIDNTTTYVFTEGYTTDPADVAEGCVTSGGDKTSLIAENAEDDSKGVSFTLEGTATGSYTDSEIFFSTNVVTAGGVSHNDFTTGTDFDLTVTEYGPVGGVIRGTFSGHVKDRDSDDIYVLSEGAFCVKRQVQGAIVLK